MSAPEIMRALLRAHGPLVAVVPPGRIVSGNVPGNLLPAIGIKEISRVEADTVSRAANSLITARVQVTAYAENYPQQQSILKAMRLGPGVHTGVIAGHQVRSVLRDIVGPDMGDSTVPTFEQSRDFIVTYIEPN